MASVLIVEDNFELAALVQAAIEARGHLATAAHTARNAREALQSKAYDVAVVDLFLPDADGGEILEELKGRNVPALAMSGAYKGAGYARKAKDVHGAKAFFEKPFPLEELLLCIEAFIGPPEAAPLPSPTEELTLEVVVVEQPQRDQPEPRDLLPLEEWERLWRKGPQPERVKPRAELARTGTLAETSVAKLLTACWQAKHTGDLVLHREPAVKVISFEQGSPVYAASNLAHERFARLCAREGLLRGEDLEAVAQLAREQNLRTGVAMVQLGVLTEAQRVQLLERQIREIIWSAFDWTDGDYTFTRGKGPRADLVRLHVFPGALIVEGYLQRPLVALRALLPEYRRLSPTATPPYNLEDFGFTGPQALLLAQADGTKSVGDLLALSDLSERETLGLLAGLEAVGIVEAQRERPKSPRWTFGL